MAGYRLNVGCGQTPTPGWINFDGSMSVRFARLTGPAQPMARFGLLTEGQLSLARAAREHGVRWADASRRIPLPTRSAEVVYSSHMLEHLDRAGARRFLAEAHRVLQPGGILRLALPDLERLVREYNESGDADRFVERTLLAPAGGGLGRRLHAVVLGSRKHHQWMYDGRSLVKLLESSGFVDAAPVPGGQTRIPNPGPLNLREREEESVYVEARHP